MTAWKRKASLRSLVSASSRNAQARLPTSDAEINTWALAFEQQSKQMTELSPGRVSPDPADHENLGGQAALALRPGGQLAKAGIKGRRLAATGRTGQDACA